MTGRGNAQPELDPEALEAAARAIEEADDKAFWNAPEQSSASWVELTEKAVSAYLLAAGGTGERELAGVATEHERLRERRDELILACLREGLSERRIAKAARLTGPRIHQMKVMAASPSPVSPAGVERTPKVADRGSARAGHADGGDRPGVRERPGPATKGHSNVD